MVGEDHLHADDVLAVYWCRQDTKTAIVRCGTYKARCALQNALDGDGSARGQFFAAAELLVLEDRAQVGSGWQVGALVDDLAEAHALCGMVSVCCCWMVYRRSRIVFVLFIFARTGKTFRQGPMTDSTPSSGKFRPDTVYP